MVNRIQGWAGLGLGIALATITPFAGKSAIEKMIYLGTAGALMSLPVFAAKEDPRQKRSTRAGELLVQQASYVGAAIEAQRKPQVFISAGNSAIAQLPGSCEIALRDLTQDIAKYDGHALIASRTRSGKTTSIQSMLAHCWEHYQGNVDFFVFDPKGAAWCGLQGYEKYYLLCNSSELMQAALDRLNAIIAIMESRQRARVAAGGHWNKNNAPKPILPIIDEFNTMLALAKEVKLDAQIKSKVQRIIFQGAEDRIYLRLMAQTTRVEDLGLNTAVQDNVAYFAQARNGDYHSVEDAIANPYVVSSPSERKRLQETLNSYKNDTSKNKEIPIVFTNLGGSQLCLLPDLRHAAAGQIEIEPTVLAEPVAEPSEPSPSQDNSSNQERFTQFNLNADEAKSLIFTVKEDLTQTEIIERLWGCKKGGSQAYQKAREQYKKLTGE